MKKLLIIFFITLWVLIFNSHAVHAQMIGYSSSTSSNVSNSDIQAQQKEEQEGKNLLDKINSKQLTCQKLTNSNFEKIGEYFMGRAIGNTSEHIVMNNMMTNMMGQQGEEQMHIAWGKRGSGCNTNASLPFGMMNMMGGFNRGFNNQGQGGDTTMMGGFYGGFPFFSWGNMLIGGIFMIIFWVLIILLVFALVKWMGGNSKTERSESRSLEILKERYAKGEISKKEFGEIKKDLE